MAVVMMLAATSCSVGSTESGDAPPVTLVPLAVDLAAPPTTIQPGPVAPTTSLGSTGTTAPRPTTQVDVDDGDPFDLDDLDDLAVDTEVVIGYSVEHRPITVVRRGSAGGAKVLVVGVIHGDEDAGADIVDILRLADVPRNVELWLVRSMNPDGQAAQERHNANGVDLNRNFAHNWGPIAQPGNWEYAGRGPASEPETQAMSALGAAVRPDLVLWYHQDLFRISPATGRDGEIRQRYAELTGLPLVTVTGGTYTGTASQWSRTVLDADGVGFTVELGATLTRDDAVRHANAVLTVASEM